MYQDTLLALSKDTRFRTSEPPAHPVSERRNPACGDEIALAFRIQDNRIADLRFHAQGCAVSVASAAAMCAELRENELDTARDKVAEALRFFDSDGEWTADWGADTLPALGAVRQRPMRMACVRLPWMAMKDALDTWP